MGRPSNIRAEPYAKPLSDSVRQVHRRQQEKDRSAKDRALANAGAADRSAKNFLLGQLKKDPAFLALAPDAQALRQDEVVEELQQRRFQRQQSRELYLPFHASVSLAKTCRRMA